MATAPQAQIQNQQSTIINPSASLFPLTADLPRKKPDSITADIRTSLQKIIVKSRPCAHPPDTIHLGYHFRWRYP
jgi:hypothetical protein